MQQSIDPRTENRISIICCPQCAKNKVLAQMTEVWLTKKKSENGFTLYRKNPKRLAVFCGNCKFDLASIKNPVQ